MAQEDFMLGGSEDGNSVMTALVTGDARKARELSEKYEIEHVCGYDGFDALLKSGKIDAIYLATPNTMHRDFTIRPRRSANKVDLPAPLGPTDPIAAIDLERDVGEERPAGERF
jgi:hypothetical protein